MDTNLDLVNALSSMCYRKQGTSNVWAKPVAHHLFILDVDTMEWSNWFIGQEEEEKCTWETKVLSLPEGDSGATYLSVLKEIERYTRLWAGSSSPGGLHLKSEYDFGLDDRIEDLAAKELAITQAKELAITQAMELAITQAMELINSTTFPMGDIRMSEETLKSFEETIPNIRENGTWVVDPVYPCEGHWLFSKSKES